MRNYALIIIGVFILGVINVQIFKKEQVIKDGQTVLLKLAPVDPRSLMQGDYMILRYAMADKVGKLEDKGNLVIKLNDKNVGGFVRIHRGEELKAGELLLMCRNRGRMRLGAESFFFQEGQAKIYEKAEYGELKVDVSGNSVLIGLRDAKFKKLVGK